MDIKLTKLIDDNIDQLSNWTKTIQEYNLLMGSTQNLSEEEYTRITYKLSGVLAEILELYFKFGSFKDKFDTSKMYLHIYGIEIIVNSIKTGNKFRLGIDEKGIYMWTWLRFPENLRHMDDNFYKDILSLMDLGKFDLEENQSHCREKDSYNGIYNNNKSVIFKLLRNYTVDTLENKKDILLGDMRIYWPYETNFYDVIYNGCLAFRTLYKLNYSLWKIHDLQTKKNNTAANTVFKEN